MLNDHDELDKLAISWSDKKCLAIDTEFERRTTYFAKLALVQVYDGEAIYLIDPLTMDCPKSFREVLENPQITKILHSSKEDLEVLYTSWNCKVKGVFDTQVAFSFLYDELSIGYAKLVEEMTGTFVSKGETNSDWIKRPLSERQLNYAAKDVLYLIDIFRQLESKLSNKGYFRFFHAECEEYCEGAYLKMEAQADYRDAKDVNLLDGNDLGLFKILFDWREQRAKTDDRTRNHIIRDQALVQLVKMKASSTNQLKMIADLHPRSVRLYADEWFDIISQWQSSEKINLPMIPNPRDVKEFNRFSTALESIVKSIAKANQISATLLLSKRLIKKLAFSILTDGQLPVQWQGWRKELLEELVADKVAEFKL